jgi:hypothetical protein
VERIVYLAAQPERALLSSAALRSPLDVGRVLANAGVPVSVVSGARDVSAAGSSCPIVACVEETLAAVRFEVRTPQLAPFERGAPRGPRSSVLSVQRMTLPPGRDAAWAAKEYPRWMARALGGSLRVLIEPDGTARFVVRGAGVELLVLAPVRTLSAPDRFVYRVAGGRLAKAGQTGTFEVREVAAERALLTVVRDFEPSLPWWIYRATQAVAHGAVMRAFGRALTKDANATGGGRA